MKGMDLFCSSPASTAICSSMEHRYSMVRHGPARPDVDRRHNPHLHGRRKTQFHSHVPCTSISQLPINPKPYYEKHRRSSAKQSDLHRKGSTDINDLNRDPGRSSRYLLSDTPLIDWLSESEPISALVPVETAKPRGLSSNDSPALKSSSSSRSPEQVPFVNLSFSLIFPENNLKLSLMVCEKYMFLYMSFYTNMSTYNLHDMYVRSTLLVYYWYWNLLTGICRSWFWGCHCTVRAVKEKWENIFLKWKVSDSPCLLNSLINYSHVLTLSMYTYTSKH